MASGSKGNCYRVSDGVTPLLLECGISIGRIKKGLGFKLHEIKGVLLTHEHGDHSKAFRGVLRAGIDIYSSKGTFDALGAETGDRRVIRDKQTFQIGTWVIRAFKTQHDSAEPLGFLLHSRATGKRLVFATDTYYIRYRFPGLTHIMVEANYAADILQKNVDDGLVPEFLQKKLLTAHFSLENVKRFLAANDLSLVEEIHLLHLSDLNSDAARFKREVQELAGKPVYISRQDGGIE